MLKGGSSPPPACALSLQLAIPIPTLLSIVLDLRAGATPASLYLGHTDTGTYLHVLNWEHVTHMKMT